MGWCFMYPQTPPSLSTPLRCLGVPGADHLAQGFLSRSVCPQGTLCCVWGDFLLSQWWWWGLLSTGIWWVEARDTAQHPPMLRADPTAENYQLKKSTVHRLRNLV